MPLFFKHVCDLLSALEEISTRDPPYLPTIKYEKQKDVLRRWFSHHKASVDADPNITVAVFSAILPARRADRVYNIQYSRLASLLKRCLCLGVERQRMLDQWKIPGRGDLADCVERVLQQTDDPLTLASTMVTLKDVDAALATLASKSRFSGPKAREYEVDNKIQNSLEDVFRRLHSKEAKWLTRMILKDFSCLDLEESIVYSAFDSRLPMTMKMYNDIESGITEHRKILESAKVRNGLAATAEASDENLQLLRPQVGIKIGPPKWVKAKGGIKHAISIVSGRTMSVEQKYDGEYCQIHIDLEKGESCIQIFSKSGKDSSVDRIEAHDAIKQGLRIGESDCQFSRNCILEGELLVWCEKTSAILDFHKIRKHVTRSGSFLGTTRDSQPHPWEHLMIVFYDILLVDDDPVIHQRHEQRRQHLKKIVKKVEGKSDIVWRKKVDFSNSEGPQKLISIFADALVQRWEGIVLKPANEPYFGSSISTEAGYPASWVKIKKDCIAGIGDSADLMAIGAAYDAKAAAKLKISNLSWTHFFIGCLTNKGDVINQGAKPSVLIFDCLHDCIGRGNMKMLNQHGKFREMKPGSEESLKTFRVSYANLDPALPKMSAIFNQPFVFEIVGSGFDKSQNQEIFTLRFPRVLKIHWDRDWKESSVSLDELQVLAKEARELPHHENSHQEHQEWVERLDQSVRGAEGKRVAWDDTDDDEEEPPEIEGKRAQGVSASSRKAHPPIPVPLVRMDTEEMRPGEKRSHTGEVIRKETLRHPVGSRGTVRSLHRTCNSPPTANKRAKEQSRVAACGVTPTKASRQPTKSPSQSKKSMEKSVTNLKGPLQEVTNSARPAHKNRQPTIDESHQAAPDANFELLPKVPAGASIYIRNKHYKTPRRSRKLPPSPAQDTSSAPTSTSTSQVTMNPSSPPRSSTPPSSLIPTSSSTITPTTLPDLTTSQIILHPQLATSPRHDTISHLLSSLPTANQIRLPPTTTTTQLTAPPTHPSNTPLTPLIFLIDPRTPQPTNATTLGPAAATLHDLALHLPRWHPHSVQIWDWHVLQYNPDDQFWDPTPADVFGPDRDEELAMECYVATMWLETPSPGPAGANSGAEMVVVVNWVDGGVTRRGMGSVRGVGAGGQ